MLTPSHGGDLAAFAALTGRAAHTLLDFSVNVRPGGPPDFLKAALFRAIDDISAYPDPYGDTARIAIAHNLEMSPAHILPGNGSNALIHALAPVLRALLDDRGIPLEAHVVEPAFSEYSKSLQDFVVHKHCGRNLGPDMTLLKNSASGVVYAANPGNPSGCFVEPANWLDLIVARSDMLFVIDEAFIDFVGDIGSLIPLLRDEWPQNLVVLRSMTKFYAVPGLRMGYLVGPPPLIAAMRATTPEWSMNTLALAAMRAIMTSPEASTDAHATRKTNTYARAHLAGQLKALPGVHVYPSVSNYLLFRTENAPELAIPLAKDHGIILRDCANYASLEPTATHRWYRVAVRTEADHLRLAEALSAVLCPDAPRRSRTRKTPALMLQGATSDAGKTVLAAAFCRIFQQDGLSVAPFKAQNMSRYGGVVGTDANGTPLEISRAQLTQALAARLAPDVRMNPVLLKPCSHTGSQVLVMGRDIGHMSGRDYLEARHELWPIITSAYDDLSAGHDLMILEGAGSPAEVNLKQGDVVNMAMARHAHARVLLAGDIDRGGLYAAFWGTCMTFTPEERALLLGFVVNRFRGDATLLAPAHQWLAEHTGFPVLGVVPCIESLGLPEEDSLSGIGNTGEAMTEADVDAALDHLANVVRHAFDIKGLYRELKI